MSADAAYAAFRARFAEALDPRLYRIEHLDALVASGRAIFMAAGDAAILFELRSYPTGAKAVHGLVAAGDVERITGLLIPSAEVWGVAQGCIGATIESRPGWARLLKPHGYTVHQVAVWKDL
jgi:hypothetical protein